eukprot:8298440-Pyramimonas_sp.AAC.1
MSHPVSSTTEQSQHETLIPLASYPDSQRKDYPILRVAGWSVVVYDANRRLIAEAWGAAPLSQGPEQLARDGGRGLGGVEAVTNRRSGTMKETRSRLPP